jgi:hypothetical protein
MSFTDAWPLNEERLLFGEENDKGKSKATVSIFEEVSLS